MSEISKNEQIDIYKDSSRLQSLKAQKYLTHKFFPRIGENLHYEILKYLRAEDLLSIRGTGLGGFQITSNTILRSRITNYFGEEFHIKLLCEGEKREYALYMKAALEQTGKVVLEIYKIEDDQVSELVNILKLIPDIEGIFLNSNMKGNVTAVGATHLAEGFKYFTSLKVLRLGTINIYIYIYIYIYIVGNVIGAPGGESIAYNLPHTPMLEILDLGK